METIIIVLIIGVVYLAGLYIVTRSKGKIESEIKITKWISMKYRSYRNK